MPLYGSGAPDFRRAPFDLGAFPEIVHRRGGRTNSASSFAIGFTELDSEERLLDFEVTFESRDAAPAPVATAWRDEAVSVEYRQSDGRNARMVCESPNGVWECYVPDGHRPVAEHLDRGVLSDFQVAEPKPDPMGYTGSLRALPEGSRRKPSPQELATFSFLSRQFVRVPSQAPPFASAPNHPNPQRTYDPMKLSSDPWGADVPSRFASLQFQDKAEWAALKAKLDAFGRESGLFDDFTVKQLTRSRGRAVPAPGTKVRQAWTEGTQTQSDRRGIRVSQVLPVLAALFRTNGPSMFLLQQPELHLHPSAQAALGSLFCRTVEAGRQVIVETHSDYIMNRIRLDVRDRRTELTHEDVSILYFEREDPDVLIHPIRFDKDGNVLGTPSGYRRFFTDELNRSLDYCG